MSMLFFDRTESTVISLDGLHDEQCRRDPNPYYARLHRQAAFGLVDRSDGDRYDAVAIGYDAVDQLLRDPRFRAVDAAQLDITRSRWREHASLRAIVASMFFTNDADHQRVRQLFSRVFTPRRVAALEPAIVRMTTELLDGLATALAGKESADFLTEFAFPLPSNVIGELLGVPEPDRGALRPLALSIGRVLEFGGSDPETLAVADAAASRLTQYFTDMLADRRREPRDDLVTALARGQRDNPETVTEPELVANLITLFNAGFVTTTHVLAAGLTTVLGHPTALADLRRSPELIDSYVEEILRLEPPSHFLVRHTTADVEFAGVPLPAGSFVLALLAAANRDPAVFAEPDRFLPSRPSRPPLTFGAGAHFCLGAALSRLEVRIALPMLFDRFPTLSLAGPPPERTQLILRGYSTLPITRL